ncbi:MAG: DUF2399 domain-containing protein [Actinomycetota bacterium]|nr:DUF2399 domain-containing protein [Actinomycetota bacterium]
MSTPAAGDPALARVWALALTARERVGSVRDGTFVIQGVTVAEADALDALPWRERRRRILSGTDLKERLSRFETAVDDSGIDPLEAYERYAGRRPRDLPAARAGTRDHQAAQRARVRDHPAVAARPGLAEALAASTIRIADVPSWLRALDVVMELPAQPIVERAVLSARLFGGDAHVLDADAKVERLARGLLARLGDRAAEQRSVRALWLDWGVETDPLSSTVLTLNLPAEPDTALGAGLAALHGGHAILTLAQLEECGVRWRRDDVFACENPTVVRAAQRALGAACAPLVCTGGWPSAAATMLLGQLQAAGARLHHHGDFDWDGLAIHQALVRDAGVVPWRYDASAYERAVQDSHAPLRRLTPRRRTANGDLADALTRIRCLVPEELVLDGLLADLRR